MAWIFLGVPIVFNVSSFKFHWVKSPWLHRHNEWFPIHPTSIHWIIRLGKNAGVLLQAATEAKTVTRESHWHGLSVLQSLVASLVLTWLDYGCSTLAGLPSSCSTVVAQDHRRSCLPRCRGKGLECAAAGDHVAAVAGSFQACTERNCSADHTAMQTIGHSSIDISVIRDTQRPWSFV